MAHHFFQTTQVTPISRGSSYLIAYPFSLALLGLAVKFTDGLPVSVALLVRFGLSAVVFWGFLGLKGFDFRSLNPSKHILRSILGFASVGCLFWSISLIPLSTALCLSNSAPIFAYLISVCTGRDHLDLRFLFVIGAVGSVVLTADLSGDVGLLGVAVALASAIFCVFALFEIKRISETEPPEAILAKYFAYASFGLFAYISIFEESMSLLPDLFDQWPTLLATEWTCSFLEQSFPHLLLSEPVCWRDVLQAMIALVQDTEVPLKSALIL